MTLSTGTPHLEILLYPETEQDLLEAYNYTAANTGQEQADTILSKLSSLWKACLGVAMYPR